MSYLLSMASLKTRVTFFGLIVLALALAGCSTPSSAGQIPPTSISPTATTASAPTAAAIATATPPAATQIPVKAATVMVSKNATLGEIVTDDEGRTLYLFTKDTKNTSNCYDKCAQAWPPLLTAGAPQAGDGANASLLGTTTRTDGTTQVTYNGWPLYYYAKDQKAGDTTGQDVGGVWYVVSPKGDKAEAATVMVSKNDTLGQIVTDDEGKTLYLFTKDTKNTSNCYDKCAQAWPPLLTAGAPQTGDGADAALLGTTTRTDGTTQVTYNGWPLYYYAKDQKAGDTTGQGVGSVWYVLSPKGDKVGTPGSAANPTSTPAPQAKTVKVAIQNFSFGAPLTIPVGTTVEWANEDSTAHTVTASNGAFDSGNLDPGASFSFTLTQEGTYDYVCQYHSNMKGQIVVTQ